jgi:hypothetical protein
MTDDPHTPFDVQALRADLAEAQAALAAFAEGPARQAADAVGDGFARAGTRIVQSLSRAAADGKITLKELAKVILEELARASLPSLLERLGAPQGGNFFGARAAGGPVFPGRSYLVGERGPELFTPRQAGAVGAPAVSPVGITLNIGAGADAESFLRHRGQIAADIARAVAYGRRNL